MESRSRQLRDAASGRRFNCADTVGGPADVLRPLGVVALAFAIVVTVVIVARKGAFPTRRFVRLTALFSIVSIVFAAWAGTHQFSVPGGECTAVGRGPRIGRELVESAERLPRLRFARTVFGLGIAGAATSLVVLWIVARERIPEGAARFAYEGSSGD